MELIELHAHFSGSMRKSTLIELLKDKGQTDFSFLEDNSLKGDFVTFSMINSLNLTLALVRRIASEILDDFSADGVKYIEIRATPKKGVDFDQVGYLNAIVQSMIDKQDVITARLIVSIDRAKGVDEAMRTYKILKHINQVMIVGVDLCGHPSVGQFKEYRDIFTKIRNMGYKVTIHAGELPESVDELQDIIEFNPDRIGHLVYFNKAQLIEIKKLNIPIEVCFSSNLCTTTLSPQQHPVGQFIKLGMQISICTDDTLCFNTTVSNEIKLIQQTFQLSNKQIQDIVNQSRQHRFIR